VSAPSTPAHVEGDLVVAYRDLQNLLLERPDVTEFLEQAAVLAASIVAGSSCGIMMRRHHDVSTVANSDDFAIAVDEIQYGRGQGPCLEVLRTGEAIGVPDLADDERWGSYRIHALAYGVRSSLSLPLDIDGETRGALNLYAKIAHSFDEAADRCAAFARQAATALTLVVRSAAQTTLEEQLRAAVETRGVVDQAVGIVMGQQRIGASEAFAILRNASQTRNRKLRDIAADLIETVTGKPPLPTRPFADPR
jgi:GAF domain-containing protein